MSERKPSTVRLENGEVVIGQLSGLNIDQSVAKQAIVRGGVFDRGIWYLTNHRIIYEGKKTGGKAVAMGMLFGMLGQHAGMDKDILTIGYDDIINMEIIPYASLDKVLKVTYRDSNDTKMVYIGVPWIRGEESTLTKFKEDIIRAKDFVSFCGNCSAPLVENEKFCPECGAKRE